MMSSPTLRSTISDFAFVIHVGCDFAGTSQSKNTNATTTTSKPRASPNRNPSVRSSAPIRLSRILSEILTVMIGHDDERVFQDMAPAVVTPIAT